MSEPGSGCENSVRRSDNVISAVGSGRDARAASGCGGTVSGSGRARSTSGSGCAGFVVSGVGLGWENSTSRSDSVS